MTASSPILPSRPLRIAAGFTVRNWTLFFALVLAGLGLASAVAVWQIGEARALLHEQSVWGSGVSATSGSVKGREESNHWIFYSYHLDVTYTDAAGAPHHGKSEADSLFKTVDQASSPEIHYDAAHPDDYALSWTLDLGWGRWASIVLFLAFFAAMGGLLVWLGFVMLRNFLDARACAERSDEIELAVLSVTEQVVNGKRNGVMLYKYEIPSATPGGKAKTAQYALAKKKGGPLFADAARTRMVALRTAFAPARPLVLRDDGYPFVFSKAEREAIGDRVAARDLASTAAGL